MKILMILIVAIAVVLAGGVWFFYRSNASAERERDGLTNVREELMGRVSTLEKEKTMATGRLEAQIAGLSKEKELELSRVRSTYDTLVSDLKGEIEQGQITITKMADRLSVSMVDRILFASGEADITVQGKKILERVGKVLNTAQKKIIRVEGHTDNVPVSSRLAGRFFTNWELSTARATNVVRFLQDSVGIAPARLEAVGMSEYHPLATNKTAAGRGKNRRIEVALLPESFELP
jgi:chemotaxis protein MotB